MNIELIKTTVDLLKKANVSNYVTLVELAKEIKQPKTKVMQFIDENSKLFILSHRWQPKDKVVTKNLFTGRKYKDTIQVRGKDLGTCIEEAFNKADENYMNIEWIERMKTEKSKYLYVSEADNYGYIEGYYFDLDVNEKAKYREYLWRNTQSKLDAIKDFVGTRRFTIGGFGDSSSYEKKYAISLENINKLKSLGWEFNNFKPLSGRS